MYVIVGLDFGMCPNSYAANITTGPLDGTDQEIGSTNPVQLRDDTGFDTCGGLCLVKSVSLK